MTTPDVTPIRVLIADDHTLFRRGLRALLESVTDVALVGEAATGEDAVALTARLQPDVVLMDIAMPDLNGVAATRRIQELNPKIGVVVLTMYSDDDSVIAAMRAGARGYVLKGADEGELLRAIHAAAAGGALFGSAVAQRLTSFVGGSGGKSAPLPELTDREREILQLMAQGHSNASIAARLVLSPKTVRNHISNIFDKLQVSGRGEAIVRAREAGLGR